MELNNGDYVVSRCTLWVWGWRKLLKILYGGCCTLCHSTLSMEFAHIIPTKLDGRERGSYKRVFDVKSNLDCYLLLCYSCHDLVDNDFKIIETGGVV